MHWIAIFAHRAEPFGVLKCEKLITISSFVNHIWHRRRADTMCELNLLERKLPFRVQRHRFGYRRGVRLMQGPWIYTQLGFSTIVLHKCWDLKLKSVLWKLYYFWGKFLIVIFPHLLGIFSLYEVDICQVSSRRPSPAILVLLEF